MTDIFALGYRYPCHLFICIQESVGRPCKKEPTKPAIPSENKITYDDVDQQRKTYLYKMFYPYNFGTELGNGDKTSKPFCKFLRDKEQSIQSIQIWTAFLKKHNYNTDSKAFFISHSKQRPTSDDDLEKPFFRYRIRQGIWNFTKALICLCVGMILYKTVRWAMQQMILARK
jgi:hypothetical protein